MRAWKDRRQPIIELKTVTIPRAQFPTRHQINSPIEIKIFPVDVAYRGGAGTSLLSRPEKRKRPAGCLEKQRHRLARETGSLSIRLVHDVCTQVRTSLTRECERGWVSRRARVLDQLSIWLSKRRVRRKKERERHRSALDAHI